MGKSIIVKGADFSNVAIARTNLFIQSQARRNYAVYAASESSDATVTTYNGFCVSNYIEVPAGAKQLKLYNFVVNGSIRFRFSKTTNDSEAVPQYGGLGLAGWLTSTSFDSKVLNIPSDTSYKYFIVSVFRGSSAAAASSADLSNVRIEALY